MYLRFLACLGLPALASIALAAQVPPAEPNRLTDAEKAAGWRLLFDGQTTAGWRNFKKPAFPAQGWVIEAGCLRCLPKGGGGDILTDEAFDDFEFAFEWKLAPGANSGVKYLVTEERGSPIAHEYQVLDDERNEDAKAGRHHQTASFYDVLAPVSEAKAKPIGEFNQSRIVVRGQRVEHWLNGAKALEYELESEPLKAALARSKFKDVTGFAAKLKGRLLLQDHGGGVWFRNLKVRALPAEPRP
jgi:hypothetical protein